jgi:hypothetical protein
MLASCAASAARHVESFISPQAHDGLPFAVRGAGIGAAPADLGLAALFSPDINRERGPPGRGNGLHLLPDDRNLRDAPRGAGRKLAARTQETVDGCGLSAVIDAA